MAMAMQEIGGSGTETDVLLLFLNLPHGNALKNCTFHKLEDKMGKVIRSICAQSIEDALNEEIRLQLVKEERECDYEKMKRGEKIERVKLTVLYDMGWSKRSSGTRYDSKSGHAFVIGALSKKVVGMRVLSKECTLCKIAQQNTKPVVKHECPANYVGSSKSMEVQAIYEMVLQAWKSNVYYIGTIVSDNDTTMKAQLKHSYKDMIEAGIMQPE